MAQYKVPQDVEADDKLIGPFSFRQFVYLLVAAGLIALAVGLFQLFPLLAIIPVPFVFFFLALALPLKKDQPMETYLAAIASYYLKPRTKVWMPGQKESAILITAPKIVEDVRTRDISEEEATHRLSFLADIVDTEGYAIKGAGASPMREDLVAEANATPDMFETYQSQVLNRVIDQDKMSRHQSAVDEMRQAISRNTNANMIPDEPTAVNGEKVLQPLANAAPAPVLPSLENTAAQSNVRTATAETPSEVPSETSAALPEVIMPDTTGLRNDAILKPDVDLENSSVVVMPEVDNLQKVPRNPFAPANDNKPAVNDDIMELAHNNDFSVATIAKEANRINNRKEKGEVFVSLH